MQPMTNLEVSSIIHKHSSDIKKNHQKISNSDLNGSEGTDSHQVFAPSLTALEMDLIYAIEHNQFELYYQPKVDAKANLIIGAEALIRWNHPEMGLILPNEFIPHAEKTGFINQIGKWVKKTAGA